MLKIFDGQMFSSVEEVFNEHLKKQTKGEEKMINDNMRFITRTSDGTGWKVSANRNGSIRFGKVFSDLFHGGVSLALAEAKLYRNSIQDLIEKESKSIFAGKKCPPFYKLAFKNSKSQVVGVFRTEYDSEGKFNKRWTASWQTAPMKQQKKYFSINKYGEEEAFKLAFEARQRGISERLQKENVMVLVR